MITGAANADVAVLVVAGTTGEYEAGFSLGGQTKEHIMLARGLGVTQIIVAINKLDVEGWKEERYNEIQREVRDYLLKQEFKPKRIQFVPISGLTGENVKERTDIQLLKWYKKGPTLLEAIDNFFPVNRQMGTSQGPPPRTSFGKSQFVVLADAAIVFCLPKLTLTLLIRVNLSSLLPYLGCQMTRNRKTITIHCYRRI